MNTFSISARDMGARDLDGRGHRYEWTREMIDALIEVLGDDVVVLAETDKGPVSPGQVSMGVIVDTRPTPGYGTYQVGIRGEHGTVYYPLWKLRTVMPLPGQLTMDGRDVALRGHDILAAYRRRMAEREERRRAIG